MLFDLRFAIRQIQRNPGLTALVVLTLALGIGANSAVFSMINSLLIKPFPYPDPEQLVWVFEVTPDGGQNAVSGGAFKDWYEESTHFSHLAVYESVRRNLTGTGTPENLPGWRVSAELLPALGVVPTIGRGFAPGEDAVSGDQQVVMLSHELWQSRYGGKEDVLGKIVLLDQVPHTIIGVVPPASLPQPDNVKFMIPIVIDDDPENWRRSGHWRSVVGRLLPGVDPAEAQTELREIKQRLEAEYPPFKENWSVAVVPLSQPFAANAQPTLVILLGTVALVLLIACANVSNLLLARGQARSREMAVRVGLGAHSWQIIRQMLIESVLLALLGCSGGLLLALFGVDALAKAVPGVPPALRPEVDVNVLAFSIIVSCVCGLLFGILPAIRASKPDLNHDLKATERGSVAGSKRRFQSLLVVAELALTVVLLITAGLFLQSFALLLGTDPGFEPRQTLAFDLSFPNAKYADAESRMAMIRNLRGRLEVLPGVGFAGSSSSLPLSDSGQTEFLSRADRPDRTDYLVQCDFISGDYFSAMGITLLQGRALTAADNTQDSRMLLIDDGIAGDLFPGENPVGQQLRFLDETWKIAGIVEPVRHFVLNHDPIPTIYLPQISLPWETSIVLRTSVAPLSLVKSVRETVLAADPDQPITNVRTLGQAVHRSLGTQRTTLFLLGLFAAVAVSLACIGIYGVISYSVGQRSRELCIRSALGAERGDIIQLVLRGGLRTSMLGIALGLGAAFVLVRFLESLLYEIRVHDPVIFVGAALLLGFAAAVATYFPARRAANIDLITALRND